MPKIRKLIEYRSVRWLKGDFNLESLCREAWKYFPDQLARTVALPQRRNVSGLYADAIGRRGFGIHCGRYVDQQPVGTISMIPAQAVTVGELRPSNQENFLNSDFIAFIEDNRVICLGCGRNAGALRSFLQKLFEKAGMGREEQMFELVRVGNKAAVRRINRVGVKRIDFDISFSTLDAISMQRKRGVWDKIAFDGKNFLDSLVGHDPSYKEILNADDAHLFFGVDLKKKGIVAGKKSFSELAGDLVEDEDSGDYVIHLDDGNSITSENMSIRRYISLDEVANTVSVSDAWHGMKEFMGEIDFSDDLDGD